MITGTGQLLNDRYRLADRIAVGGMGEVWRATDDVLDRPVAVKILRPDLASDTVFRQRFRAEARTAAMLTHSGIAAVYDYGEALGTSYLVMELVPGEPLSALISREGALGTERTLDFVAKTARALEAAHRRGIVHRDVKPANLIVTPDGRIKVTDFGIARPQDHEPLTATGQVMGTAHYLAPEVARGEPASPLSDVYALGVVMYECLAGWRPFDGVNQVAVATAHLQQEPPPLPGTVPAPVREAVSVTMSKDPSRRPQGAAALADVLQALARQPRSVLTPAALAAQGGGLAAIGLPAGPARGNGHGGNRTGDPGAGGSGDDNGPAQAWSGLIAPAGTTAPDGPGPRVHRDELRVEHRGDRRDESRFDHRADQRPDQRPDQRSGPPGAEQPEPALPSRHSRRAANRPTTSVLPALDEDRLRRPRRRRRMPLRAPLAALIALVLLVLAGTVMAALLNGDGNGDGLGPAGRQVSVRSQGAAGGNPIAALRVREVDARLLDAGSVPTYLRPAGPSPSTTQGWQQ